VAAQGSLANVHGRDLAVIAGAVLADRSWPYDIRLAKEATMPEKRTLEAARRARREGKRPTTQAGEFIREEMHHIRSGKHGARSTKQAIAIGLSKARRSGVKLGPPPASVNVKTRESAAYASRAARSHRKLSKTRSRAISRALKREGRRSASRGALATQARQTARSRGAAARKAAARKAAGTRKAA
jgi:hypothetical protein